MVKLRQIVCWLVGGVFIVSGLSKAVWVSDPHYEVTLVWELSGRSVGGVAALAAAEVALGSLFVLGVARRQVRVTLIVLLLAFSAFIVSRALSDKPVPPCGCFGVSTLRQDGSTTRVMMDLGHNLLLILAALWTGTGMTRVEAKGRAATRSLDP